MPEVSQELVNVCATLVYRKWAEAVDNQKAVKEERDDGSEDWALFHAERLRRAEAEFTYWQRYLDEIKPLHTIGKG